MSSFGGGGFQRERVVNIDQAPIGKIAIIAVVLVASAVLMFSSITTIPAGHVGVLTLFGKVSDGEPLPSGLHFINPFKRVHEMSVRTLDIKEAASVPSSEGLLMTLDTSLLYRVDPAKAADLYRKVGPNYREVVIEPNLRSAVRTVTAAHTANALYSGERERVAQQIFAELHKSLEPRGVLVESVLLRDIQLPPALKSSIEAKQQAEQESLAMSFRLQKERQEAERKRIEAEGIRDFQKTVSQGISAELLTWKGIEATESLARSSNSKIVIIGNTKNGLPLVMSGQ